MSLYHGWWVKISLKSGWWFGTFPMFPYILGRIIPAD